MHKTFSALAAAGVMTFAGATASAAVTTMGCLDATSCTLTEAYAGGTITVDDVIFSFPFVDDFGSVPVDTDAATITGVSGPGTVALDFAFTPGLSIAGGSDFIAHAFDIAAQMVAGSSRGITVASLSFTGTQFDISGDAQAKLAMSLEGGLAFLDIFDDSIEGTMMSDSTPLSLLTTLAIAAQLDLIGFETAALASVTGFRLELTVQEIPVPGALPLFIAGLAALGLYQRRRKKAHA